MAIQPLVGAKLMSTLSSRCLLAPMPFVRARLMSTLPLRCLSMSISLIDASDALRLGSDVNSFSSMSAGL